MPDIPYTAERFNAFPPTAKLAKRAKGRTQVGSETVSKKHIAAFASSVGDTATLGGMRRPWLELQWREAMARSSLTADRSHYKRSASYNRLDPSEKSAVSYFLGMTQCALMAERILHAGATVHVDSLLGLKGVRLPKSRPDLIGYTSKPTSANTHGRFLLEAKGRTHGYSQGTVDSAMKQLRKPDATVQRLVSSNPIYAASLSYFAPVAPRGTPIWRSYLSDPPPPSNPTTDPVSDSEFCGLVLIAQLLPIQRAIADLSEMPDSQYFEEPEGFTGARLLHSSSRIAIPTHIYRELAEVKTPLKDPRQSEHVASKIWELNSAPPKSESLPLSSEQHHEVVTLGSGLTYFSDDADAEEADTVTNDHTSD